MNWADKRKLAMLKVELAALEKLDRKVRDAPGETTALAVQNMVKIGDRLAAVKREIRQLETRQ